MNKNKLHNLLGLWACLLLFTACTDETSVVSPDNRKEGRVTFSFSVGNGSISRAPESGWSDWNENKIEKVHMFISNTNGNVTPYSGTSADLQGSSETGDYTWQPAELTRDDIQEGDEIYVIANSNASGLESVSSITDLQQLQETGLAVPGKQDAFLMDGYKKIESADLSSGQITIDLKRAAAKIRLTFDSNSKADWDDEIAYSFCQYATKSTILDLGENSYLEDPTLVTYPEGSDKGKVHSVTEDDLYTYDNKKYLVLYSYANDWFDDQKNVHEEEPINDEKQTYIMLKAPYEGTEYYYKIPVNYRLPDNNDDLDIDPDTYKHLYRLQRNYIYDITVSIDHKGGTYLDPEEVSYLTLKATPWDMEDITVNYEDNLSYTSSGWGETVLGYLNDAKTQVQINPGQTAVLTFMINTPSGALWRATLSNYTDFQFVGPSDGVAYSDGKPMQQTIQIRALHPESDKQYETDLHVYADIGGITYEMDLTNPSAGEIEPDSDPVNYFTLIQSR